MILMNKQIRKNRKIQISMSKPKNEQKKMIKK